VRHDDDNGTEPFSNSLPQDEIPTNLFKQWSACTIMTTDKEKVSKNAIGMQKARFEMQQSSATIITKSCPSNITATTSCKPTATMQIDAID
jgi:hypothetical protein